jgi:cytidylate kinase
MEKNLPFIISIGHQLGSGGAYIGQALAKKLNMSYIDHEIIRQASKQLAVLEEDLEARDEKLTTFWHSFLKPFTIYSADPYIVSENYIPTDNELFKVESKIIERISTECSAVIIGRCSSYVLRNHPNHISIFLHGSTEFRGKRIKEMYNVDKKAANQLISNGDSERAHYNQTFAGKHWMDANLYDLSIDTSKIGLDKSVELILEYINEIKK